jgi:hypothetical protein
MEESQLYRWERRRHLKQKRRKFHFGVFDFLGLTLFCMFWVIGLRILFFYTVTNFDCFETLANFGASSGLPPAFPLLLHITVLFGLFWICVGLHKALSLTMSRIDVIWHIGLFVGIFILGVFIRAYIPSQPLPPPDGTLVVQDSNDSLEPELNIVNYAYFDGEEVYAHGVPQCVWLDTNRVTQSNFKGSWTLKSKEIIGFGRPHIDYLQRLQSYRELTPVERDRFVEKQACMSDITLYGQLKTVCEKDYLYRVALENWPSDEELKRLGWDDAILLKRQKLSERTELPTQ